MPRLRSPPASRVSARQRPIRLRPTVIVGGLAASGSAAMKYLRIGKHGPNLRFEDVKQSSSCRAARRCLPDIDQRAAERRCPSGSSRPSRRRRTLVFRRPAALHAASVTKRRFMLSQCLSAARGIFVMQPRSGRTAIRASTRFDGIQLCQEIIAFGEYVPFTVDKAHSVWRCVGPAIEVD